MAVVVPIALRMKRMETAMPTCQHYVNILLLE